MEELEKNETSTQAEENTVSLASAQALADALAKIEAYTPTTWVDNSSPDIDAEHLNKPEQAIKRVTDALNSAVDVIKDLQSQVTKNAGDISTVNNNLSKAAYAIPEITLEDILDLSIPDGVYKAVPSTKNLPQTQYGKVEIYSDKTNQWRFVRYTTTQPSRVWITFYNGYGSTVGWNDWEQIATKSDLSWKTLGTVSNTETLDISNITKTANEICIVVYFLIDKNERDYFYIIPVAGLGSGGSVVTIGGYYITAGDYGVVQVRASTSEIGLVTVYHGGQDVRSKASLKVRYR